MTEPRDEFDSPWKEAFWVDLEQYEQEQQMPYVTSVEQIGIEKGREQGREEGREEARRSLALKMLEENIPLETITRITELTIAQLQQLQARQEH